MLLGTGLPPPSKFDCSVYLLKSDSLMPQISLSAAAREALPEGPNRTENFSPPGQVATSPINMRRNCVRVSLAVVLPFCTTTTYPCWDHAAAARKTVKRTIRLVINVSSEHQRDL